MYGYVTAAATGRFEPLTSCMGDHGLIHSAMTHGASTMCVLERMWDAAHWQLKQLILLIRYFTFRIKKKTQMDHITEGNTIYAVDLI